MRKDIILTITILSSSIIIFVYLAGSSTYDEDNQFCIYNGYDGVSDGWFTSKYEVIDEYYQIKQKYASCVKDDVITYVPQKTVRPMSIIR